MIELGYGMKEKKMHLEYSDKDRMKRLLTNYTSNYLGDSLVQAFLLRLAKSTGDPDLIKYTMSVILDYRREFVGYLFSLQSKWQNKNVNYHHDSFELRESYVAPHILGDDEYRKRQRQYNKTRKPELFKSFNRMNT